MPKFNMKAEDKVRLQHMLDVVWSTSTEDIPPLIMELKRLLGKG